MQQTDLTLPGRNGLSFELTRKYDSKSAQFYEIEHGENYYDAPVYLYFVTFNAVKKPLIPQYIVKYVEQKFSEEDYNNDGIPDFRTGILSGTTKTWGVYPTQALADQAKNAGLYYSTPTAADTKTVSEYRISSTAPTIPYNSGGYSGTLTKDGAPEVYDGSYTPQHSKPMTSTCVNTRPGMYDAQGQWTASGDWTNPCPSSIQYNSGGY